MKNHFFTKFSSILSRASVNFSLCKKDTPMEANNNKKNNDDYDLNLPKKIVLKIRSKSSDLENCDDEEGSIIIRKFSKDVTDTPKKDGIANTSFQNIHAAVGTCDVPKNDAATNALLGKTSAEGVKFYLDNNNYTSNDDHIEDKTVEIETKFPGGEDLDDITFLDDVRDIDNLIKQNMKRDKTKIPPSTKDILEGELRTFEQNLNESISRSNVLLNNGIGPESLSEDDDYDEDIESEVANTVLALQNQNTQNVSQPSSRVTNEFPQFLMLSVPKRTSEFPQEPNLEKNENVFESSKNHTDMPENSHDILSKQSDLNLFHSKEESPTFDKKDDKMNLKLDKKDDEIKTEIPRKKEIEKEFEKIENMIKLNETIFKDTSKDFHILKKELSLKDDEKKYEFTKGPIYLPKYVEIGDNLMYSLIDKSNIPENDINTRVKVHGNVERVQYPSDVHKSVSKTKGSQISMVKFEDSCICSVCKSDAQKKCSCKETLGDGLKFYHYLMVDATTSCQSLEFTLLFNDEKTQSQFQNSKQDIDKIFSSDINDYAEDKNIQIDENQEQSKIENFSQSDMRINEIAAAKINEYSSDKNIQVDEISKPKEPPVDEVPSIFKMIFNTDPTYHSSLNFSENTKAKSRTESISSTEFKHSPEQKRTSDRNKPKNMLDIINLSTQDEETKGKTEDTNPVLKESAKTEFSPKNKKVKDEEWKKKDFSSMVKRISFNEKNQRKVESFFNEDEGEQRERKTFLTMDDLSEEMIAYDLLKKLNNDQQDKVNNKRLSKVITDKNAIEGSKTSSSHGTPEVNAYLGKKRRPTPPRILKQKNQPFD